MLIKIVKNGVESEWFELTKRQHRALLVDKPEMVIVHIDEFYPEGPDTGRIVSLEFEIFTTLARDFVLMENAQKKSAYRHHDRRSLETINPFESSSLITSVEEELSRKERRQKLYAALATLTATQRRRLWIVSITYAPCGNLALL